MTVETHSALVTGGGTGIGLACAAKFVEHGATVGLLGRTESKLEQGKQAILEQLPNGSVTTFVGDTADEAFVAQALKQMNAKAP